MSTQKEQIFIGRNPNHIVIVDMNTCQKLIVEDKAMMEKSDEELKKIFKNFGILSQNARV